MQNVCTLTSSNDDQATILKLHSTTGNLLINTKSNP